MNKKIFFALITLIVFLYSCRKANVSNDICDCAASKSEYVIDTITLTIPNLITPNNDGFNDCWHINNIEKFPDNKVKITRTGLFGGTVFETTDYKQDWCGDKKNAKPIKDGKYKYEIITMGQTYTGFVCVFVGDKKLKNHDCIKSCVIIDKNDNIINH